MKNIKKIEAVVESSTIQKVEWTPGESGDSHKMIVTFNNGSRYEYSRVGAGIFIEFLNTESIGRFFNANFRDEDIFPCEKLPEPEDIVDEEDGRNA